MLSSTELLAAVRAAQGLPSNYALAKLLGLREKDVSRWNTGANVPSDAMALRLAGMAGLDPAHVLASMHAQRCTDELVRPVLETIAERARAVAASLALVVTAVLSVAAASSNDAQARAGAGLLAIAAVLARIDKNHNWRGFALVAHAMSYCTCPPAGLSSAPAGLPKVSP